MISDESSIQIVPGLGKITQGGTVPITLLVPPQYAGKYMQIIAMVKPQDWSFYVEDTPSGRQRIVRGILKEGDV